MPETPDFDVLLKDAIPSTVSFNTRDQAFIAGHEFVYAENGKRYVMAVASVTRTEADWGVLAVVAQYKQTLDDEGSPDA